MPLLADVDRFEEVGAGARDAAPFDRAKVGDRNSLDRRLRQKEEPDGHVHLFGEVLELLDRGLCFTVLPRQELWEPVERRALAEPGALIGPAQ